MHAWQHQFSGGVGWHCCSRGCPGTTDMHVALHTPSRYPQAAVHVAHAPPTCPSDHHCPHAAPCLLPAPPAAPRAPIAFLPAAMQVPGVPAVLRRRRQGRAQEVQARRRGAAPGADHRPRHPGLSGPAVPARSRPTLQLSRARPSQAQCCVGSAPHTTRKHRAVAVSCCHPGRWDSSSFCFAFGR